MSENKSWHVSKAWLEPKEGCLECSEGGLESIKVEDHCTRRIGNIPTPVGVTPLCGKVTPWKFSVLHQGIGCVFSVVLSAQPQWQGAIIIIIVGSYLWESVCFTR